MKRKIVKKRRVERLSKSNNGKHSKYAEKKQRQKAGRYSSDSPFTVRYENRKP